MGIRGLTTYIGNHSHKYLQDFELHDSYLIIDGCSVAAQLYNYQIKCNCAFGGDYDKYAFTVSKFFDELLQCNIIPLVLYDGGTEEKKLKTKIHRIKQKIKLASYINPSCEYKKFLPLLQLEVFTAVVKEKNIRHVRCTFEADDVIAAVAKALNCPVLSYDSDFYIYGVLYIPFNTLDNGIYKSQTSNCYVKQCKIYKVQNLLNSFHGLTQSMLPLAAILLGNDYVQRNMFKNFYYHIKLSKARKANDEQRRIESILNWLKGYTLNNAITTILSRLPQYHRQRVLEVIELVINGYNSASINILTPLGFLKEFINVCAKNKYKPYKFEGDINNLAYIEETSNTYESELSEEEGVESEFTNIIQESECISSQHGPMNNLPQWFLDEFNMASYPSYFMDILTRRLYITQMQIEDHFYPTTTSSSAKIIHVIYCLLTSGIDVHLKYMHYIARGNNGRIAHYRLEKTDTLFSQKLPSLLNLKDEPLITKKNLLNNVLGVTQKDMNELPPEWSLYVVTVIYWSQQEQEPLKTCCHIYSILFAMLYNIIDRKIGYYRSIRSFQIRYAKEVEKIHNKHKSTQCQLQYSSFKTIVEVLDQVTVEDCLLVAPFFISHFEVDQKLLANPKKFNKAVVHTFNELQNCMRHIMNLNALLGYPYQPTKIDNVFNGTLLYNLYMNFQKRKNVIAYVKTILQNSQSLLHLFNALLSIIIPLLKPLFQEKMKYCEKKRSKRGIKKDNVQDDLEDSDVNTDNCEISYHDPNNPFSIFIN